VAYNVGSQNRSQFALLTGQWNFPAFPQGIVRGLRPLGNQVKRRGVDQNLGSAKGDTILVAKQASGTAKIDTLMAAFNATAWMAANPASTQPSIFWI
jgi:hypothetical protein